MSMNRTQIRNLLLPGMMRISKRGVDWTEEELDAVLDVYMAHKDWRQGAAAARELMDVFQALPLTALAQQLGLARLKSVSAAYRRSRIPSQLRKDPTYDCRKSTAKAHRRIPQAARAGRDGGTEAFLLRASPLSPIEQLLIHGGYSIPLVKGQNNYTLPGGHGVVELPQGIDLNQALIPMPYHQGIGARIVASATVQPPMRVVGGWELCPPPVPPLPRKVIAGEITAWRCWCVVQPGPDPPELRSTSMLNTWPADKPLKMERGPGSQAYLFDYGMHGIHAFKQRWRAYDYATTYGATKFMAIGQVELWGEVVEHRIGYRAEYAQVVSIEHCTGGEDVRAELCLKYNLPYRLKRFRPRNSRSGALLYAPINLANHMGSALAQVYRYVRHGEID